MIPGKTADASASTMMHIRVPNSILNQIDAERARYGESRSSYMRRAAILLNEAQANKAATGMGK